MSREGKRLMPTVGTALLLWAIVAGTSVTRASGQQLTGDLNPPTLSALSLNPTAVNVTNAPATIMVTATITDDLSGVCASCLSIQFVSPTNAKAIYGAFGSAGGDQYTSTITIPRWVESGIWTFGQLILQDKAGNVKILYAADLAALGITATFDVTSTPDAVPPALTALTVAPDNVDVTTAPAAVTVTATITDNVSGVCVGCMRIQFVSPSKTKAIYGGFQPGSGNQYTSSITIPRWVESGTWTFGQLILQDNAGNMTILNAANLAAAGITPPTIAVTSEPDNTPPTLTALSANPTAIDVRTAARTVTITATITDDVSGVCTGCLSVQFVAPSKTVSAFGNFTAAGGNTFTATLEFAQYAQGGKWTAGQVILQDNAGNVRILSATDLQGFNVTIDVTSIDLTPPAITITSRPPAFSNNTTPSFAFSADEPATFQCALDNGAFAPCASPVSYSGLSDGSHTFYVKATDSSPAQNTGQTSYTWTLDTVPPVVTVPADITQRSPSGAGMTVTFTASATDDVAPASPPVTCSPASGSVFPLGATTVTCGATDAAGNKGTASFKVTIVTSPDLVVTKTDSVDPVEHGDTLSYFIRVRNNGPVAANGVTLTDTLPAGTTFLPGQSSPTCSQASLGAPVICNIGSLAVSVAWDLIIQVTVPPGVGTITNTATAAALEGVMNPAHSTSSENTEVMKTVAANLGAGGSVTTDTEANGATPSDPFETTVTTPNAGFVSIRETPTSGAAPSGFSFLGVQVNITAPPATATDPLIVVFRMDASIIPAGQNQNTIEIRKNGNLVPDCTGAGATPDPCIATRALLADGDVEITVRTSTASRWDFVTLTAPLTIQALALRVQNLNLAPGEVTSLTSKLKAVEQSLDRGSRRAAANQLAAFIHEVEALKRSLRLDSSEADSLIWSAQALRRRL